MSLDVSLRHDLGALHLDVDFTAPRGVTVLFGRSGAGKSTIVNAVAGLLRPRDGRIQLEDHLLLDTGSGVNLPPHRRGVGYVFQEGRLFPHLTVRQNLAYGRWFATQRKARADYDRIVEILGLGDLLTRRPGDLSGGEKQRVAIGRALLAEPQLLLADEPLAALDEARKGEILPYFEALRDEIAIPILYVTHSAAEVARLATTVIALQDGRVARQGPAIEVLGDPMVTPAGARAAGAVLEAVVSRHHIDGLTELDAGGVPLFLPRLTRAPGARLRVRIAAHEVMLATSRPQGISALNILPGTIEAMRAGTGPGMMVSLMTPAGPVLARVTRRSAASLGLTRGADCFAIVKSIAIAPEDVGGQITQPGPSQS